MTIYGPNGGVVTGQPISPFFGAQNGANAAAPVTTIPANMTLLEAVARGVVPRNMDVTAVAGVSTGAQNPTPIDDLLGNGAGNQVNAGVAIPGAFGNPAVNGAINQEVFVDGVFTANAGLSTGSTPFNSETLTSGPVSGATTGANITLGSTFQG